MGEGCCCRAPASGGRWHPVSAPLLAWVPTRGASTCQRGAPPAAGYAVGMDREAPERAELLEHLAALGAKPDQLHRAALVPVADLAALVRWWRSLLPSTRAAAVG